MTRIASLAAVVLLAGGAAFLGLRVADDDSGPVGSPKQERVPAERPDPGDSGASGGGRGSDPDPGAGGSGEPGLPESSCPPELSNCVVASGRVIYVEAVDPDGDGDAHFVTTSDEGVTFPGVTVFDVRTDLRPSPLPREGDLVGGAGPVFRGSHGQKQIEVIEFHVAR